MRDVISELDTCAGQRPVSSTVRHSLLMTTEVPKYGSFISIEKIWWYIYKRTKYKVWHI